MPLRVAEAWPWTVASVPALSVADVVPSRVSAPPAVMLTSPAASSLMAPSYSTVSVVEPMVTVSAESARVSVLPPGSRTSSRRFPPVSGTA